jgi:hypothetical protein
MRHAGQDRRDKRDKRLGTINERQEGPGMRTRDKRFETRETRKERRRGFETRGTRGERQEG